MCDVEPPAYNSIFGQPLLHHVHCARRGSRF